VQDHFRLRADRPREQDAALGELGGKYRAVEPVSNGHTAGAGVGVLGGVGVVLAGCRVRGPADDRIVRIRLRDHFAEIDARLVNRDDLSTGTLRCDVADRIDRVSTVAVCGVCGIADRRIHSVRRRGNETVAVGIHGVPVDPVGLIPGETVRRQFAGADDVVPQLAVDVITIDVQFGGEAVEVLELLLLSEGSREHIWVEQPDIGDGRDVRGNIAGILGADAPIVPVLNRIAIDSIRLTGRGYVAFDVLALDIGCVRAHRELLHEQRPPSTDQNRGQHE
jgi:hypothetical protein